MKLFEDSTNISDSQLDDLFKKKKDTEMDLILKTLSMIIYQNSTNLDIMELYKLLGVEKFSQVVMLFDGRPIKLPTSEELKQALILSLIYYYHEVQKMSWEKVKEKFPFEISGISYGIKLKQLSNFVRQKMEEYLKNLEE